MRAAFQRFFYYSELEGLSGSLDIQVVIAHSKLHGFANGKRNTITVVISRHEDLVSCIETVGPYISVAGQYLIASTQNDLPRLHVTIHKHCRRPHCWTIFRRQASCRECEHKRSEKERFYDPGGLAYAFDTLVQTQEQEHVDRVENARNCSQEPEQFHASDSKFQAPHN